MTDLVEAHAALRAALEPLRIEVGAEVLAMWQDSQHHGRDPLPAGALRQLALVTEKLAAQRNTPLE